MAGRRLRKVPAPPDVRLAENLGYAITLLHVHGIAVPTELRRMDARFKKWAAERGLTVVEKRIGEK